MWPGRHLIFSKVSFTSFAHPFRSFILTSLKYLWVLHQIFSVYTHGLLCIIYQVFPDHISWSYSWYMYSVSIWFIAPLTTNVTTVLRVNCSLVEPMIFYNTMDCCVKHISIYYTHSWNFLKWFFSLFLSIFEYFLLFWCCSIFLVWITFLALSSRFFFLSWCCFESLSWILFLVVSSRFFFLSWCHFLSLSGIVFLVASSRFFLLLWCRFISSSWILISVVSSKFFLLCWCFFVFLAWILFFMVLSRFSLLSWCCVLSLDIVFCCFFNFSLFLLL